jgi:catechol 2,3-dioxygenase-like lactoylglutathione lyase family enzyme
LVRHRIRCKTRSTSQRLSGRSWLENTFSGRILPILPDGGNSSSRSLRKKKVGETVQLPDGRQAEILKHIDHEMASKRTFAFSWKLQCDDGQTVFIKRLGKFRDSPSADRHEPNLFEQKMSHTVPTPSRVGIKGYVHDLPRAREFYEHALGLEVRKQSSDFVNFAGTFALIALPIRGVHAEVFRPFANEGRNVIYIETQDPKAILKSVRRRKATIVTDPRSAMSREYLRSYPLWPGNVQHRPHSGRPLQRPLHIVEASGTPEAVRLGFDNVGIGLRAKLIQRLQWSLAHP